MTYTGVFSTKRSMFSDVFVSSHLERDDQNMINLRETCILAYKSISENGRSHQYVQQNLSKNDPNLIAKIHFFWKGRNLRNTLAEGAKNGFKKNESKGVPLYSPFFKSHFFARSLRGSVEKGGPQKWGVDTQPFPPNNEQKNVDFWRFLTKKFSFFKKRHFCSFSQDESSEK